MKTLDPLENGAERQTLPFGESYYKEGFGPIAYERNAHWLDFFAGVAQTLVDKLSPRNAFDAGCAWGLLVEALRDRGVDARGCDVSDYAIAQVRSDVAPYCHRASLIEPIRGGPYDLLLCIEVLEHMGEWDGLRSIQELTAASDAILFSSTPDDLREETHINVHPPIYWLRMFSERGFNPDLEFDASFIAPHAFLVRRSPEPLGEDVLHLFAEVLRNRCDRAAFLQRHDTVRQLERECQRLETERDEARSHLFRVNQDLKSQLRIQLDERELDRLALDRAKSELADYQLRYAVTREQLTIAHSQLAAAVSARMGLEREAEISQRQLVTLHSRSSSLSVQLGQANKSIESLGEIRHNLSSELTWLRRESEVLDMLRRRLESWALELRARLERDQFQFSYLAQWLKSCRTHHEEIALEMRQLSRQLDLREKQLNFIHTSRSWQVISIWQKSLDRHRWFRALLEPVSRRFFGPASRWIPPAELQDGALSPVSSAIGSYPLASLDGAIEEAISASLQPPPEMQQLASEPTPTCRPDGAVSCHTEAVALIDPVPSVTTFEIVRRPLQPAPLEPPPSDDVHPPEPVMGRHEQYQRWIAESEPDSQGLDIQRRISQSFSFQPRISVVVPVYRVRLPILQAAIESVIDQTYGNWELCLSIPISDNPEAAEYLTQLSARDARIRVLVLPENLGISGNSNAALTLVTGDFLALLDHDDTLAPFALFEVVERLNRDRTIDFIYSDKDGLSEDGLTRLGPLFKPQWSPEVMLNANYLTHLCVMRTSGVRAVGGWRSETDGAQDWDIFLRVIRISSNVCHIPKVLYHWRRIDTSVALGGLQAKPYADQGQIRTVSNYCASLGLPAQITRHESGDMRVIWPQKADVKVSVLLVRSSSDQPELAQLEALRALIDYPNFEILFVGATAGEVSENIQCVDEVPERPVAQQPFTQPSFAGQIESMVRASTGEILVFLDEFVTPSNADWLRELAGPFQLGGVGLVSPRLIDSATRRLRHCGIVITENGRVEYIYAGEPEHVHEQFGGAGWYRNWSAVPGACFAVRRETWNQLRVFEGNPLAARFDIDLSLRLRTQTELRIVYNPYAHLSQSEEALLERPRTGMREQPLKTYFLEGDPFFNPNLECTNGIVSYRQKENVQGVPVGRDYAQDSRVLVSIYDFTPSQAQRSLGIQATPRLKKMARVTWLLPDFHNSFYGGIHTLLRFADAFQRRHQVQSDFCVIGHSPEKAVRQRLASAFPALAATNVFVLNDHRRVNELPESDAVVSTLWTTAYAALEFNKTRQKFYFIQDDEPLFYPAGSTSALVEATYGFGFRGICNTVSLLRRYEAGGGQGEYFNPSIDLNVFHDRGRAPHQPSSPQLLFCYARPDHPRNCFELLAAALRKVKERMGERVVLVTAGAGWDLKAYGLDGVVENLGLLNYETTGALYRICDAGLVMMMTRHPSYLPLELMACGSLVITNRNPDTAWLLKDRENCLLADPSASSLAETILEGLSDDALRGKITSAAKDLVASRYSNWDLETEKIYHYMASQC